MSAAISEHSSIHSAEMKNTVAGQSAEFELLLAAEAETQTQPIDKTAKNGDAVEFSNDMQLELKNKDDVPTIAIIDDFSSVSDVKSENQYGRQLIKLPSSHGELSVNAIETTLGSQSSGHYEIEKIDINKDVPSDVPTTSKGAPGFTYLVDSLANRLSPPDYLNISWNFSTGYNFLSKDASRGAGYDIEVTPENIKDMAPFILKGMEIAAKEGDQGAADYLNAIRSVSSLAQKGTKIYIAAGNNTSEYKNDDTYDINVLTLAVTKELDPNGNIKIVTGTSGFLGETSNENAALLPGKGDFIPFENQLVSDYAPAFTLFERANGGYVGYGGNGLLDPSISNGLPENFAVFTGSSGASPYLLGQDVRETFFKP